MLQFTWLTAQHLEETKDFLRLFESAFPIDEIEPSDQIIEEIKSSGHDFRLGVGSLDGVFCGLLRVCLLRSVAGVMIVHIAVEPKFEGQGIGKFLLGVAQELSSIEGCDRWIFAEMDPVVEGDVRRERRYAWFLRNGFEIITKSYTQPSVREGCEPVDLWLLGKRQHETTADIGANELSAIFAGVYEGANVTATIEK